MRETIMNMVMPELSESDSSQAKAPQVLQVGPDRVTILEHEVVIEAKRPMPDWEVRELNPVPLYFDDKKFFLIEKRKGEPPYAVRYLLHPWPADQSVGTKLFYTYDAEAVAEREAGHRSGNRDELIRMCLLPFYPFLGLLWSRTQQKLSRFGFVPHAISGISIFTTFLMCFAQGVFATVMINASLRSGKMMLGGFVRALASDDHIHLGPVKFPIIILDSLLIVACITDAIGRYNRYLHDDQWDGGFLEWLFRRQPRLS